MATFRVRVQACNGEVEDFDFEYQGDAEECFFENQHDDNVSVEVFNVWSTGTEDLVDEWHNNFDDEEV